MKNILYILIGILIFSVVYYDSVLDKPPLNMHVWRQADCLSITKKYQEGASFLEPEMHCQLADNLQSGKSAGEFPLLYYINGKIWNITGESFFTYRVFYLLILIAGLVCFYLSLMLIFQNVFWSVLITLLLYTSPAYVFYSVSFLTDAPAFSFVLIAIYFYLRYFIKKSNVALVLATLFFTIAGLIKISSLIIYGFFVFIYIIELIPAIKTLGKTQLYNHKIKEGLALLVTLVAVFFWVSYAVNYNELHGFKYTFNDIAPIWELNDYSSLLDGMKNTNSHIFYSRAMLFTLLFLFIINLFTVKKIPIFVYTANIVITIGAVIYFLLWGPLFGVHDYYYLPFLSAVIGIIISFVYFFKQNNKELFSNLIIKVFGISFLMFNFIYCTSVIKLKTFSESDDYLAVGNSGLSILLNWSNSNLKEKWHKFYKMRDYLNVIGVKENDKVISINDESFNVSLYLMNRDGWTNYLNYNKQEDISVLIKNGAKYLFIIDDSSLEKDYIKPFTQQQIGYYEGVKIFKLTE